MITFVVAILTVGFAGGSSDERRQWMGIEVVDEHGEAAQRFVAEVLTLRGYRWRNWATHPEFSEDDVLRNLRRLSFAWDPGRKFEDHPDGLTRVRVPSDRFLVVVQVPGYRPAWTGSFAPDEVPESVRIELSAQPRVYGQVISPDGPVAGALVELWEVPLEPGWLHAVNGFGVRAIPWSRMAARTNESGVFVHALRPGRLFLLRTRVRGFALEESVEFKVAPDGSDLSIHLELSQGGSLVVSFLPPPGGTPAGVMVAAHRGDGQPEIRTSDGISPLTFESLAPGTWFVEQITEWDKDQWMVNGCGTVFEPLWNCEVLEREGSSFTLDLRRGLLCSVTGRVQIDGELQPGSFAIVPALRFGSSSHVLSWTDDHGHFEAAASRPGQSYLRFAPKDEPYHDWIVFREIELSRGSTEWTDDLVTATIEGRLPESFSERPVSYYVETETVSCMVRIRPDDSGAFRTIVPAGAGSLIKNDADLNLFLFDEEIERIVAVEAPAGEVVPVEFD